MDCSSSGDWRWRITPKGLAVLRELEKGKGKGPDKGKGPVPQQPQRGQRLPSRERSRPVPPWAKGGTPVDIISYMSSRLTGHTDEELPPRAPRAPRGRRGPPAGVGLRMRSGSSSSSGSCSLARRNPAAEAAAAAAAEADAEAPAEGKGKGKSQEDLLAMFASGDGAQEDRALLTMFGEDLLAVLTSGDAAREAKGRGRELEVDAEAEAAAAAEAEAPAEAPAEGKGKIQEDLHAMLASAQEDGALLTMFGDAGDAAREAADLWRRWREAKGKAKGKVEEFVAALQDKGERGGAASTKGKGKAKAKGAVG